MKAFIVFLLMIGGGYYWYTHGLSEILDRVNMNPKEIVQETKNVKKGAAAAASPLQAGLPEIAPERLSGLKMSQGNFNLVETTIFNTYEADVCFAFVDMVYASGSPNYARVVNKYLSTFSLPEEREKILVLVSRYKDKQSLKLLQEFSRKGVFSKKLLARKIAEYENDNSSDERISNNNSQRRNSENNEWSLKDASRDLLDDIENWDKYEKGNQIPKAHRASSLMDGDGGY